MYHLSAAVSSTLTARNPPHTNIRQGGMLRTTFTTLSFPSRNVAFIGNDMKNVWMALQRRISNPSPDGRHFLPIRPRILSRSVRATRARTPPTITNSSITADAPSALCPDREVRSESSQCLSRNSDATHPPRGRHPNPSESRTQAQCRTGSGSLPCA